MILMENGNTMLRKKLDSNIWLLTIIKHQMSLKYIYFSFCTMVLIWKLHQTRTSPITSNASETRTSKYEKTSEYVSIIMKRLFENQG